MKKNKIINIVSYILLIISLVIFCIIPSFHIFKETMKKNEELHESYKKWYVVKVETILYISSENTDNDKERFLYHLKAFDRTIEYLFDENIIAVIDLKHSYVKKNQEIFLKNWREIQLIFVQVVNGLMSFESLADALYWVTADTFEFDIMFEFLIKSTNDLNQKNLKRYLISFYILFTSVIITFFLFLLKNIEFINAKKTEAKVRNLSLSLDTIRENERKRISLDLHDLLIQRLIATKKKCTNKTFNNKNMDDFLDFIAKELDSMITTTREISFNLKPIELEYNFIEALQYYIADVSQRTEIEILFSNFGFSRLDLSENIKINLFRIIQESFNNIEKHSNAENVIVKLSYSFPFIILNIEDDGIGITDISIFQKRNSDHMGLNGIKDRVELLNGTLKIISAHNKGFKLFIKIPYSLK